MKAILLTSTIIAMWGLTMSCATIRPRGHEFQEYQVHRLKGTPTLDARWDKPQWRSVKAIEIKNPMGGAPEHFPRVRAKLLYDDVYIYVIFRVEDRYVRAVAKQHQGEVWKDSCVEFFFTPGEDVSLGYLNLEVNCGGTALFHFQKAPRTDLRPVEAADLEQVEIAHSMPKIVDPEIAKPVTWTIEYRIPFAVIARYCRVDKPAPGVVWRANFYKIADDTSHPHWLTWSVVDKPKPDFHQPAYFGVLRFR
jgi:hypothetical protein